MAPLALGVHPVCEGGVISDDVVFHGVRWLWAHTLRVVGVVQSPVDGHLFALWLGRYSVIGLLPIWYGGEHCIRQIAGAFFVFLFDLDEHSLLFFLGDFLGDPLIVLIYTWQRRCDENGLALTVADGVIFIGGPWRTVIVIIILKRLEVIDLFLCNTCELLLHCSWDEGWMESH